MNEHRDIHEAILAVMEAVPYLQKRSSKELNYTFAGESDLIHKVRGAMLENGICVHPMEAVELGCIQDSTNKGTKYIQVRYALKYRFAHSPSQTFIEVQTIGEARDYGDKACNKAMTIGLKYALRQTFLIETGDDPDIIAHNRDEPNSNWLVKAVERIDACKTLESLDDQMARFRGTDPNTGNPLFSDEQLGELAARVEKRRGQLRKDAA